MLALTDIGFAASIVKKLAAADPEKYGAAAASLDTKAAIPALIIDFFIILYSDNFLSFFSSVSSTVPLVSFTMPSVWK